MRKITEALRLHFEHNRTNREIAQAIGVSPTTIGMYLRRAREAGIDYPLPEGVDNAVIETRLFPPAVPVNVIRLEPDWVKVHQEMRKKSVTLDLLWQEYKAEHPDGYRYSWFCEHYRQWAGKLSVTMRQTHPLVKSYLLTTLARHYRLLTAQRAKFSKHKYTLPYLVHLITLLLKPLGRKNSPIGLDRMYAPLSSLEA